MARSTKQSNEARKKKAPLSFEFVPTDEMRALVRQLAKEGLIYRHICAHIINPRTNRPIDVTTFMKNFRDEVQVGRTDAFKPIHSNLYQRALAGEEWAIKFWTTRFDKMCAPEDISDTLAASDNKEALVEAIKQKMAGTDFGRTVLEKVRQAQEEE